MPARRLPVVPDRRGRGDGGQKRAEAAPRWTPSSPSRRCKVPSEGFALHMMGIGGTGVVTINQILGTAAMLDGRHVRGLDQTGLSQKGGPVVSDLKIASAPIESANKVSAGARGPLPRLRPAGGDRSQTTWTRRSRGGPSPWCRRARFPPARWWWTPRCTSPSSSSMLIEHRPGHRARTPTSTSTRRPWRRPSSAITWRSISSCWARRTRRGRCRSRPPRSRRRSGSTGSAIEMNLLAFRWGRMAVVDRSQVESAVAQATRAPAGAGAGAERGGPGPGGPDRRHRRAAAPAGDPGAGADRVPGRGLRGRVRRLRGPGGGGGGGARARPARAGGGDRALPLQADGVQGRVRGGAAAPRRGGAGAARRASSAPTSRPTGTCTRRSCARWASRRRSVSGPGSRPSSGSSRR